MTKNSFSVHSDLVRWVLVETSHAGNVGSTARALKTMGFEQLHLIRPRQENMHEDAEAIALASGASDVLAKLNKEKVKRRIKKKKEKIGKR